MDYQYYIMEDNNLKIKTLLIVYYNHRAFHFTRC